MEKCEFFFHNCFSVELISQEDDGHSLDQSHRRIKQTQSNLDYLQPSKFTLFNNSYP